jgi:O-antigen/teichoic acid export membrane protein
MLSGQGLRLVIQAVYFTVIARSLGPDNYGAFIGVVALVGIAYPFGMLGSGNLLVKNVSRNRAVFPEYWGQALAITAISSTILFTVIVFAHSASGLDSGPFGRIGLWRRSFWVQPNHAVGICIPSIRTTQMDSHR